MPTMCIQCAMRAMLNGDPVPHFDEEPREHQLRMHPDPVATQNEREELERLLREKLYVKGG